MTGQLPEPDDAARRTAKCRACSAAILPDSLRCDRCGAMQVDVKCPHCGATAGVSPDRELRFVCDVCGAPRVPVLPKGIKTRGREIAHLKRADSARRGRAVMRALSAASGAALALGTLVFGVLAALLGLGIVLGVLGFTFLGALLAVSVMAGMRARARGAEIAPALDAAWVAIATDAAAQQKQPIVARDLAKALSIDEAQAEQMLALLDVNDVVKSEVTDEGELAYSTRFRVQTPAAEPREDREAAAEAEAEAAFDERLATAQRALVESGGSGEPEKPRS